MHKPQTVVDRAVTAWTSENEMIFVQTEKDDMLFSPMYYCFSTMLDNLQHDVDVMQSK